MKVAIVGSRTWTDASSIHRYIDRLIAEHADLTIVSGAAPGVDRIAAGYAVSMGLTVIEHHADWKRHGRTAGAIRNQAIVSDSDAVVAFWDGVSRGTKITLDIARRKGITAKVVSPSGEETIFGEAVQSAP